MPEITEAEFKKHLEKSDFSNLYVLYGEEKHLIGSYTKKLINKASGSTFSDFNLQCFDDSASIDEIATAVEALPFMAERKCVAVSDLNVEGLRAQETSKLDELISNIPETTVLIFYFPTAIIDYKKDKKWEKFFTSLNQSGCTLQLKRRSNPDLEKLLCTGATKRDCTLLRTNAARVIGYCGTDMQTLLNELEKLCAFAQGEITAQIVDQIVVKNLDTKVYDLSKAIIAGEYDKAYNVLDLLFYQNEEPVSILAVLSSAYIDMYRVRTSVQSGSGVMEPAKYFDYARREFCLTNAERDSKKLTSTMLRLSLKVLLKADTALKSARGDRRIIMEKLIAQLLIIAEGERIA